MEMILTDADRLELSYLDIASYIDIDVGNTNDFEISLSREDVRRYGVKKGCCIFAPGTEFGGIIEDVQSNTEDAEITFTGYTWRGLLKHMVIEPPSGQSYLTVSGDANRILKQVLNKGTGLLFEVPDVESGINISKHQFRYTTALEGLTAMLEKVNARLDIKAMQGETRDPFKLIVRAVNIKNYSEDVEYNGDNQIGVSVRDFGAGINHLICLGKGELTERTVVHLYVQLDGSIGKKQYYKGTNERTAVYDYSSAENAEVLETEGKKRLKELMNYKSATANTSKTDLAIGDIVSARDRDTGVSLSRPVVNKIYTYQNGIETLECKLKGEQ